jgi:hypothetical protein
VFFCSKVSLGLISSQRLDWEENVYNLLALLLKASANPAVKSCSELGRGSREVNCAHGC